MRLIALTIAALAGVAALPASAAPEAGDVSCVALFATKGKAAAAQSRPVDIFLVGSYDFVGNIRARNPDADLAAPLAQAIDELGDKGMETELQRCLAEVQEKGGRLRGEFARAQEEAAN